MVNFLSPLSCVKYAKIIPTNFTEEPFFLSGFCRKEMVLEEKIEIGELLRPRNTRNTRKKKRRREEEKQGKYLLFSASFFVCFVCFVVTHSG